MMRPAGPVRRVAFLALLLIAGSCSGASYGPPSPQPTSTRVIEVQIHELINHHRASRGLGRLTPDQVLDALAREHSERMARGDVPFGHDGLNDRYTRARISLSISRFSENVATNSGYPAAAVPGQMVAGWINSPSHRQNLEGAFRISGVGIARSPRGEYFGTQVFAD